MTDPTERFSNRVDTYVRARPSYPLEVLDLLAEHCGLAPQAIVADVGAGTGILTRLLLGRGATVFAVEPNAAMRAAAEATLGSEPDFRSIAATAEATTLPDRSIDLLAKLARSAITAGQAFHWFDPEPTRREWARILRPGGWAALIWNDRRAAGTHFLEAYEQLLQTYRTDYASVNHRRISESDLQTFFGAAPLQRAAFHYRQTLDLPGLEARLVSSSYTPAPGQPGHAEMLATLAALFAEHQEAGQVIWTTTRRCSTGGSCDTCCQQEPVVGIVARRAARGVGPAGGGVQRQVVGGQDLERAAHHPGLHQRPRLPERLLQRAGGRLFRASPERQLGGGQELGVQAAEFRLPEHHHVCTLAGLLVAPPTVLNGALTHRCEHGHAVTAARRCTLHRHVDHLAQGQPDVRSLLSKEQLRQGRLLQRHDPGLAVEPHNRGLLGLERADHQRDRAPREHVAGGLVAAALVVEVGDTRRRDDVQRHAALRREVDRADPVRAWPHRRVSRGDEEERR
jgi:SAM-dependent methyltransferase